MLNGPTPTRAQRNNNPGNIDRTAIRWLGMAYVQADPRFITFVDAAHGFRAMARIIHGHWENFRTVAQIIARDPGGWAPPEENNSSSYVNCVAARMCVRSDRPLTWDIDSLSLLRAMAIHENNEGPAAVCLWPDSDILAGIHLEATT